MPKVYFDKIQSAEIYKMDKRATIHNPYSATSYDTYDGPSTITSVGVNAQSDLAREFDTGLVSINDHNDWTKVTTVNADSNPVVFRVGAGAASGIVHLKVGAGANPQDTSIDFAVDTDLNAEVDSIPYCTPVIGAGAAIEPGSAVQFMIDAGMAFYDVYAKASGTTIDVSGRVIY